ncbi:TA system VapC family ribonuclease toxin [Saccharomonospora xinjiangensis]|uniref:TA system VapC family ribonuclease toxin n=1 Tax=Saccharomonospora xinjiangensis TaxID=75294 RepID=UPI00106F9641|nr:TA system VapC family ribonuclease toxin [Saccharomonospora xinjiangensis]QBQ60205.1 Ribonuclease VapC39 [Saccharomonospora xinjiangensis]
MTTLLDANVLIALVVADHVHHDVAEEWFARADGGFATCPVTEGSLLRLLIREGQTAENARCVLDSVKEDDRHEFWPDTVSYSDVPLNGVLGHRQVTDAYLAQLARSRGCRIATFDQGFAELHADVAELVPVVPAQPTR